jgi:hypothetical protein
MYHAVLTFSALREPSLNIVFFIDGFHGPDCPPVFVFFVSSTVFGTSLGKSNSNNIYMDLEPTVYIVVEPT